MGIFPNGTQVWSNLLGSEGRDFAYALCIDKDDGIYVVGRLWVGLIERF
jgi:hypothetical protein